MACPSFSLSWHEYQASVTSVFDELRHHDELVDITLCCEGQRIGAHRMLLSACSPYFRDVLKANPCQHMVFYMKDTSASDLRALVEFMYKGSVNVSQNQLASFIRTAKALQIRGLSGGEDEQKTGESEETGVVQLADTASKATAADEHSKAIFGAISSVQHSDLSASDSKKSVSCASLIDTNPSASSLRSFAPSGGMTGVKLEQPNTVQDLHETDDAKDTRVTEGSSIMLYEDCGDMPATSEVDDVEDVCADGQLEDSSAGRFRTAVPGMLHIGHVETGSSLHDAVDALHTNPHALVHRRVAVGVDTEVFSCRSCGKCFKNQTSLRLHRRVHDGMTTCPVCAHVSNRVHDLRVHLAMTHCMSAAQVALLMPRRARHALTE